MPAMRKAGSDLFFAGIAYATPEEWFSSNLSCITPKVVKEQQEREYTKALSFVDAYGGKIYKGYHSIIASKDIDAIYMPLPPALHYQWAKKALENGKHVFLEKPSTTNFAETKDLVSIAEKRGLALHENYMFVYHSQLDAIQRVVQNGEIGEVRLYRITFGFPQRAITDFRYNKALGGGALLDAGGYTFKLATQLLGPTIRLTTATAGYTDTFDVDIFGSATMINEEGTVAQVAVGMDNDYRCDLEIWGSKGTLTTKRSLTAPDGFGPNYIIKKNQEEEIRPLPTDDAFLKSIGRFILCVNNERERDENYKILILQERLVEDYKVLSNILQ